MKKLVLMAALAASTMSFADLKIGTVDMMALVRNHSSYEPNRKLLLETEKDYTKKLDAIKAEADEIQEEGKNIADQLRNPLLAQTAQKKLEKELVDIQAKFVTAQQRLRSEMMRSQQDLQDLENRLLKATTEDLHERIDAFAAAEGYDLILDVTAAPFAKKELDVTAAILATMGVTAPKSNDEDVKDANKESK